MTAARTSRVPLRIPHGWVSLAFLSLAVPLLSGCIGAGSSEKRELPMIEASDGGDVQKGEGAINGTVMNENGAALNAVHLILAGTTLFTTSDKFGHFRIDHVTPGRHYLRADLTAYQPLESNVEVEDGKVAQITLTLVSATSRGIGFRDHVHDLWGDEKVLLLFERRDLTFPHDVTHGGSGIACAPPTVTSAACNDIPIVPELDRIVWPGTGMLEVTVDWQKKEGVRSVDFQFATANQATMSTGHLFKPGETQFFEVSEAATDHGHQRDTLWVFQLRVMASVTGTTNVAGQYTPGVIQDDWNERMMGPFSVKILARKGTYVPTEPAHARYWAEGDRVVVADLLTKSLAGTSHLRDPHKLICLDSDACFSLPKGRIVPPGTTRLEVTFTYDVANAAVKPIETQKTLGFRTGSAGARSATWDQFRFEPPTSQSDGKVTWALPLKDDDSDAFYQAKSVWNFMITKAGDERGPQYRADCITAYCGGDKFTLHIEAVNEDWTPELAAG